MKNLSSQRWVLSLIGMMCWAGAPSVHAQSSLQTVWQSTYQVNSSMEDISAETGVIAERLTIQAESGRLKIRDLELVTLDGDTINLNDLLTSGANSNRFKTGLIDRTGDPAIPRSITLDLGKKVALESLDLSLENQLSTGASISITLQRTSNARPPEPQPPRPQPTPPSPRPPAPPVPPAPRPICNVGQINQEIGMCRANVQNQQDRVINLTGEMNRLQGQISILGDVRNQYDMCLREVHRAERDKEQQVSHIERLRSETQRLAREVEVIHRDIQSAQNYPRGFRCWIRNRHGQIYEAQGAGSPISVMRQLKDKCGENECGKNNWNADWGCQGI